MADFGLLPLNRLVLLSGGRWTVPVPPSIITGASTSTVNIHTRRPQSKGRLSSLGGNWRSGTGSAQLVSQRTCVPGVGISPWSLGEWRPGMAVITEGSNLRSASRGRPPRSSLPLPAASYLALRARRYCRTGHSGVSQEHPPSGGVATQPRLTDCFQFSYNMFYSMDTLDS